jgi:YggT family protein
MFVIGNLLEAVAAVLNVVLQLLLLVIFVNALLSWVRPDPSNPIVMTLDRISDLICNPIRRIFPTMVSGIDFAPFIAMLAIWLVQMFLVGTLRDVALRMG